jgi:hypothetical protein
MTLRFVDVGFLSMTQPLQTTIRRLGPGDEEVVRKLAERSPQTNELYASLGGIRQDTVQWDF